jgi:hypothetical protein
MLMSCRKTRLDWNGLDLPLSVIEQDWYGRQLDVPVVFALALDPLGLWFVAGRQKAARVHPQAGPGEFVPGLWQYDVAELFIGHPDKGRYLEFNLAPNGAWWSAEFTSPRVRANGDDVEIPGVKTYSEISSAGGWRAAAVIPLKELRARLDFGAASRMNVTFIIDSPEQKFLTANPAPAGEPDFHHPDLLARIESHDPACAGGKDHPGS